MNFVSSAEAVNSSNIILHIREQKYISSSRGYWYASLAVPDQLVDHKKVHVKLKQVCSRYVLIVNV